MSASSWVFISLSQTKINDMDNMLLFLNTDEKIVWFDISMQKSILVNKFDSLQHLNCKH